MSSPDVVTILDYGMGNLRSVANAFGRLGVATQVQPDLADVHRLVIPGVGAFGAAMEKLLPLREEIRSLASQGVPILGICLGQQLLFDSSEEFGSHEGLGLISGRVAYFDKADPSMASLKIPQIGWNSVEFRADSKLGAGIPSDAQVYFVHSLVTLCDHEEDVAATTDYGIRFASAVERGNVMGTQFHPEKSGDVGLQILRNFACW